MVSPHNGAFLARAETPVHSDFFPTLEYMSQIGFFLAADTKLYETVSEMRTTRGRSLLAAYLKEHPLATEDFSRSASAALDSQFDGGPLLTLMWRWAAVETNSTLALEMIEKLISPTKRTPKY